MSKKLKRFTADLDPQTHERLYMVAHLNGHKNVVKYLRELINLEYEKIFQQGNDILEKYLSRTRVSEAPNFSEDNLC